jgi:serine/threonine protein kinase
MLVVNQLLQSRYLIVRKLGEGGMGAVYEAKDQRLNNTVALKETKLHEGWLLEAFAHEAQILANLHHAALPRVMDHFTEGDGQFLIMEFIPGDDLASRMETRDRPFDSEEVLNWGDQLLDALQYLHTRKPPIIHRDVKPHNLKLTDEGNVILLDFGLAKTMLSGTIVYGCSNHYSPLEQKRAATTDARSDLYSFAATLYYLMTARKPADAEARSGARAAGQGDPLLSVSQLNPNVSRTVSAALIHAMALDASARPPSAMELRRMLNDARRNSSSGAARPGEATPPRRIEISLAQGAQSVGAKPHVTGADLSQPHAERQPEILRNQIGSQDSTDSPNSPSSHEMTLMSKVRSWGARNFVVALAQLVVAILAVALTLFLYLNSRTSEGKPSTKPSANNNGADTNEPPKPTRAEAMSYYVELKDGHKTAMARGESLSSDQRFKFHFTPRSRGYLYIIAPGEGNVLMTFLTDRPIPDSGVTTNAVEAGADYQFPNGNWIGLRDDSYQTPFTIVFSPTRLAAPEFFSSSAGRILTVAEQRELDAFLNSHPSTKPDANAQQQGNESAAILSMPAERAGRDPLIFRVAIARK